MTTRICSECGHPRTLTSEEVERLEFEEEYRTWCDEHRGLINAVSDVITKHVVDNNFGSESNLYDWPDSEAVVIIKYWDELKDIMRGIT